MKILMFGWEFPPFNSGGLGVACQGLSSALLDQGVDITFVLPKKFPIDHVNLNIIFADNTNFKVKAIDSVLHEYITSSNYKYMKNGIYGNSLLEEVMRYAQVAGQIAKREQFDLIHAHEWLSFPAGLAAKRVSKKKLVSHVHATEFDRTGGHNLNQDVYNIERNGMHKADKVIAVSDYTKRMITSRYGISSSKVHVVHNGIDKVSHHNNHSDPIALKNNYKIVLFLGRLTLQKGPDYFLKAAQIVLKYHKNVMFVVAGNGDMRDRLVREATLMGISDNVIFTGFLRGEELKRMYHAADLFVMPSVSEPFGITALEALSYGTPILISKQSGVSEVISNALRVDFWDVYEMANKIVSVLNFPELYQTLKTNGGQEVERVNWRQSAHKTIQIYNQMLFNI